MPQKKKAQRKRSSKKTVQNVSSKMGREMVPYPTKGTCPKDPPPVQTNPPRRYKCHVDLHCTSAANSYITVGDVRTYLTSNAGIDNPSFVLEGINVWGDYQHTHVWITDVRSGITLDDSNGNVLHRPRVSMRYSKNIQPLVSASDKDVHLALVGVDHPSGLPTTSNAEAWIYVTAWSY